MLIRMKKRHILIRTASFSFCIVTPVFRFRNLLFYPMRIEASKARIA